MNKLIFKVTGALATSAIVASGLAGAAFADNSISGNGAGSINGITTVSSCTSTVSQSNGSFVGVGVVQKANTGGNKANSNTGGNVSITTGSATQSAVVSVGGSSNTATAPSCCGCLDTTTGNTISDNGNKSVNGVSTVTVQTTGVAQANQSAILALVKQKAKTGKNKANKNTNGSVDVITGNTSSSASVGVTGSTNTLQ